MFALFYNIEGIKGIEGVFSKKKAVLTPQEIAILKEYGAYFTPQKLKSKDKYKSEAEYLYYKDLRDKDIIALKNMAKDFM